MILEKFINNKIEKKIDFYEQKFINRMNFTFIISINFKCPKKSQCRSLIVTFFS